MDLFADDTGSGTPVLLIPGLSGSSLGWTTTQTPVFSDAGFRCIAIDNRDVGQSPRTPGRYTVMDMAQDAVRALRARNIAGAHIVGWSMGGMIAQELALAHPETVHTLTLYSTDPGQGVLLNAWANAMLRVRPHCNDVEFARVAAPWIFGPAFLSKPGNADAFLQAVATDPHPQPADCYVRQAHALLAHDARARLSAIRAPTLIVAGTYDLLSPHARISLMASAIPHARVQWFDSGHCASWECTESFNAALLEHWRA